MTQSGLKCDCHSTGELLALRWHHWHLDHHLSPRLRRLLHFWRVLLGYTLVIYLLVTDLNGAVLYGIVCYWLVLRNEIVRFQVWGGDVVMDSVLEWEDGLLYNLQSNAGFSALCGFLEQQNCFSHWAGECPQLIIAWIYMNTVCTLSCCVSSAGRMHTLH